jgi:tetratricopeptide (TPR) repeat protein
VQQEVSVAVAEEIRLTVDASVRRRLREAHAADPEAYQDYLLGRFHWNTRNRDGLFKSVEYFQRAIARDPQYARAYAGLADSYLVLGGGYLPDIEAYNKARAAARKALELDGTLSDAYTSLAYEEFVNERDMNAADDNYQRALTLDPNNANAHHWYALYLSAMKRPDEAIEQIGRALELDPLAIGIRYNAGSIYLAAGRLDEAEVLAKRAIELDPNCAPAHGTLALIYEAKQWYPAAIKEFETAQKLRAGYSPYAVEVAHMYALEGNRQRARTLLASLLSDSGWAGVAPYSFALTYTALGQKDYAFLWLKRCADDHSCTALEFNSRALDPLRSDRRFSQIVR